MGDKNEKISSVKRFAIVIGANNGGPDRAKLRYAISDAQSISRVFKEMGGVHDIDNILLKEPNRNTFFSEMRKLQKKISNAKAKFRRVEVIVYYSGHSDEYHILLGNEKVSYKEFRDIIDNMLADVRIAILDSCASGAFTRIKGGKKKLPFLMDNALNMRGYAFMTSSSSNEASQESDRLEGSFFTHNLIAGLRGAADVTQDGRITFHEAYQYAYSETLSQTEKTIRGPQHANYNIQMSGTGDVVITEIIKSTAVLVIGKDISGKVFIHNSSNALVMELNKTLDRIVELGMERGKFLVVNIKGKDVFESKITLHKGKSFELSPNHLKKTDKIYTQSRGGPLRSWQTRFKIRKQRLAVEFYGGFSRMNPSDLNLRAEAERQKELFLYEQQYNYLIGNNQLLDWEKGIGGEFKTIKNALPIGFRIKYFLKDSLAFSLGLRSVLKKRHFEFLNQYIVQDPYWVYQDKSEYSPYELYIKALIPLVGVHVSKKINRFLGFEGYFTLGPVFAQCSYTFEHHSERLSYDGTTLYESTFWSLVEQGKGTGYSIEGGVRINRNLGSNLVAFMEAGYAQQVVNNVSGPGRDEYGDEVNNWQGEWNIKSSLVERDWGSMYLHFPSNKWDEEGLVKVRDFKLNLSGFQLRIGLSYRF
jgi:hypothetical protein